MAGTPMLGRGLFEGWSELKERLIEPSEQITQTDQRRQARLLAIVLIVCLVMGGFFLGGIPLIVLLARQKPSTELVPLNLIGMASLATSYWLLRRGQLKPALLIMNGLASAMVLLAYNAFYRSHPDLGSFLAVPVIIAAIFFSGRSLVLYLVVYNLAVMPIVLMAPAPFVRSIYSFEAVIIISLLVVAAQRSRQQLERDRQAALASSEARLRAVTDTISDVIFQTDKDLIIRYVSPSFQRITGWPTSRVLDRPVRAQRLFCHPDDRAMLDGNLTAAVRDRQSVSLTYRFQRSDSSYIWLESAVTVTCDAAGSLTQVTISSRDISDRKQAEAMYALDRMKDEFISTVAHELRTPLGMIQGLVDLLLSAENAPAENYLEQIHQHSQRLTKILDDLLDIERLKSQGGLALQRDQLSLSTLVDDEVQAFQSRYPGRHFIVAHALGQPMLIGDPRRLAQVVRNLLSNAVKYSPEQSPIRVRTRLAAGRIEVSIYDSGPGLDPGQLARLFEAFYRAPEHQHIYGTGLGLRISRTIALLHDGDIRVESTPGEGSCFTLCLPLEGNG